MPFCPLRRTPMLSAFRSCSFICRKPHPFAGEASETNRSQLIKRLITNKAARIVPLVGLIHIGTTGSTQKNGEPASSSLIPRPFPFLPSVCIHNNTQERKTSKKIKLVFCSRVLL